MLAIRLPPEIEARLERLACRTGRTTTFYARAAILEYLDDLEDLYLAEKRCAAVLAGKSRTFTREEVGAGPRSGGLSSTGPRRTGLARLDRQVARRIIAYLRERVAPGADPRALGEALHGERFGPFRKYRLGNDRVIARIDEEIVRILVVRVGHRRDLYR